MSRWTRAGAAALLLALTACMSNTATREPVSPVTYTAPNYRAANSVGRLARLAVAPVVLHWQDSDRREDEAAFAAEQEAVRAETRDTLMAFLAQDKGYAVVPVVDEADWPDDAARATAGQRLGVDGIVVVERWIREPWTTWDGLLNIVLLNGPLVKALTETNLRMSIYETASGRLVWTAECHGWDDQAVTEIWGKLLVNLDNAVPAVLQH